MKFLLCVLAVACVSCSSNNVSDQATNLDAGDQQVATSSKTTNKDDEVVCRRIASTGSNMTKKVCQTRGQMREQRRIAQENAREERGNVNMSAGEN